MNILLVNDDGIECEGIIKLAKELQKYHDVYVVAPEFENSANSHSITIRKPMELKRKRIEGIKNDCYSLSGTPSDCVRIGLELLYKDKDIDIIFSGINRGLNTGADVQYSGTVGACAEAVIYNKPGVAVSSEFKDGSSNFDVASKFVPIIFEKYKNLIMEEEPGVFSINVPKLEENEIKGTKICRLGGMVYDTFELEKVNDDFGIVHLLERKPKELVVDTDQYYIKNGYITITPIKYSFGDDELFEKYESI